jgi:hypothetical protein
MVPGSRGKVIAQVVQNGPSCQSATRQSQSSGREVAICQVQQHPATTCDIESFDQVAKRSVELSNVGQEFRPDQIASGQMVQNPRPSQERTCFIETVRGRGIANNPIFRIVLVQCITDRQVGKRCPEDG